MTDAGRADDTLDLGGRIAGDLGALDEFARELRRGPATAEAGRRSAGLPARIEANPATVEKDLAKLVLSLVDLVRQLVERQAIRRVNAGSLSDDEVERMGETFLALDRKMTELRGVFGLEEEDLNIGLGPIHNLR